MKIKRIISGFLAIAMCFCMTNIAFAAETKENQKEVSFIPLEVIDLPTANDGARAGYTALGSTASDLFWYNTTVKVSIPSAMTTYKANRVGIIIVDRTDGSSGAKFTVTCTGNKFQYTVGKTGWTYHTLNSIRPTGGSTTTFTVSYNSGAIEHQYQAMIGLFYYE